MIQNKPALINVSSSTLMNGVYMPQKYICERQHVHPPFSFRGLPLETASIAMTLEKVQESRGVFDHWVIWNIHPMEMIIENTVPGTEGKNSFGKTRYQGPCPPEGRDHRYFFKVYALDIILDIKIGADKKTLEKAMQDHTLAKGEIIGMYKKTKHKNL